jgi:hypothetical protein
LGIAKQTAGEKMNELEPETKASQWFWFGAALLAMTLIAYIGTRFPG